MNEQTAQLDVLRATVDPLYLDQHAVEANAFADANLGVDSCQFVEALEIKATLGMHVEESVIRNGLQSTGITRQKTVEYLARVQRSEFGEQLVNILNELISGDIEQNTDPIFWTIKALALCGTSRAKLFINGLQRRAELTQNPILEYAIRSAAEELRLTG